MASSPSPSPDPDLDPGRHTEPGDVRVILQPHVHETMGTLAAYLGFDHIANLKQCLFSPLVVMITRLLWPLVYDLSDSSYMDKIFAWFLEIGSDAQFRAHYARSADVVTTCLRDALANSNVKWEDDDDVARAIACLLVWASDVLSGPGTCRNAAPRCRVRMWALSWKEDRRPAGNSLRCWTPSTVWPAR
ncbi:hypothetical protein PG991_006545 [Apiospora marii]|uniref:Uncharacterized protein n=1 Tax=Apiospora marii TaxID=335849 RepID=A0ABR1RZF4_9PEZI